MEALAVLPDFDDLRAKAGHLEDLITPPKSPRRAAPTTAHPARGTAEQCREWYRRVEDSVLDLSNALPQGVEDYDARKLLEFMVELRRLIDVDPEARDPSGEMEIATMRMADVVRRIERRLLRQHLDDPTAAVEFVLGVLANVPVSDTARLLGVSTKTVGAWRQGSQLRKGSQRARRVLLVAQLLSYLRDSMTPYGLVMWFDAERDQLGGRTPLELIEENEAKAYAMLTGLARGSRGQLAG
jgi:DNA-binding transcriptional regulator YiaG